MPGPFATARVTAREVVRHALHVTGLHAPLARLRTARGQDISHLTLTDRRQVFTRVYDRGVWRRDGGALSGLGSELAATEELRSRLAAELRALGARTLLDVGCGDFTWMQHVDLGDIAYTGVDIVASVVEADRQRYGLDFRCLDAVSDPVPAADVALCREVLFHLPLADGRALVANLRRCGVRWLVATSDTATGFNADIRTGDFRLLNLRRRPYRLPAPLAWISDGAVVAGRGLGVWALADLPGGTRAVDADPGAGR